MPHPSVSRSISCPCGGAPVARRPSPGRGCVAGARNAGPWHGDVARQARDGPLDVPCAAGGRSGFLGDCRRCRARAPRCGSADAWPRCRRRFRGRAVICCLITNPALKYRHAGLIARARGGVIAAAIRREALEHKERTGAGRYVRVRLPEESCRFGPGIRHVNAAVGERRAGRMRGGAFASLQAHAEGCAAFRPRCAPCRSWLAMA